MLQIFIIIIICFNLLIQACRHFLPSSLIYAHEIIESFEYNYLPLTRDVSHFNHYKMMHTMMYAGNQFSEFKLIASCLRT
jgi:hypothetical protein